MGGTTFVLVHGAFHGAWCWERLIPALAARGARAVALDLPGFGDDTTPLADVSLAGNAAAIASVVRGEPEPVVLVGHSLGGVSIAAATELVPEQVRLLVYLTAFLPQDGDSVASLSRSPAAKKDTGPSAFGKAEDGESFWPLPERARGIFYSGCSDQDVAYAVPRLRPQPYAIQRTPVHLTAERYGRVPRAFIECLDDNAISLGLQRDMATKGMCMAIRSLSTDHSPFFSAPDLLADTLIELAGG